MSDVYVFLGPSLSTVEARKILNAVYLPPVSLGDICALALEGARAILIIDGLFEQVPTVWHKEILFALSERIPVFGASSMGAIRAAELSTFGMIGVGSIYEGYEEGRLEDEDEVTIVHSSGEFDFRPLSEAMVNIRFGLEQAEADGVLSKEHRRALEGVAKRTYYPDRSWDAIYLAASEIGITDMETSMLRQWVNEKQPNLKRDDAVAALKLLDEYLRSGGTMPTVDWSFESTYNWEKLVRIVRSDLAETKVVALTGASSKDLTRKGRSDRPALLYLLAHNEARRLGIAPTPQETAVLAARTEFMNIDESHRDEFVLREYELAMLANRHSSELALYAIAENSALPYEGYMDLTQRPDRAT
ncbi:MAG: TfuA-like protein [Acidimicrobiales bacterium]